MSLDRVGWRPSVSGDNGVAPMVSLWWSCSAGCGCRDRSSSGRSCCSCCMRRRCRPRGMGWPLLSGACELSCLPTAPLFSALLSWWLTWWWIASRCGPLPVLRSLLAQCHPPSGPAWAHPCSGAKVVQWVWQFRCELWWRHHQRRASPGWGLCAPLSWLGGVPGWTGYRRSWCAGRCPLRIGWRRSAAAGRTGCQKVSARGHTLVWRRSWWGRGPRRSHRTGQYLSFPCGRRWSSSGAWGGIQSCAGVWTNLTCWPGWTLWSGLWKRCTGGISAHGISLVAVSGRRSCRS